MSNGSHAKGMACSGYIAIVIIIVIKFKGPETVNNILRIKCQRGSARHLSQGQTPGTVTDKKEPEFTDEGVLFLSTTEKSPLCSLLKTCSNPNKPLSLFLWGEGWGRHALQHVVS